MRGFIDIWSFLSWGYRKRNDPPHGVAHAEDDLAGFPDDFWKNAADGWILPNAPVPWKKQSAVLRKSRIPFDWIFLSSHRIIS